MLNRCKIITCQYHAFRDFFSQDVKTVVENLLNSIIINLLNFIKLKKEKGFYCKNVYQDVNSLPVIKLKRFNFTIVPA